jgi:hypothetical protein
VPAKDAYTGSFFRRNREYAETFGDDWAILSAKHGLVAPNFLIPGNYNNRFHRGSLTVTTHQIRQQVLKQGYHRFSRVVVLGGKEYGAAVAEAYAGIGIEIQRPLEKFRAIGFMIHAVIKSIKTGQALDAAHQPRRIAVRRRRA